MLGKCLSSGRKLPEICSFVCSECAAQDLFCLGPTCLPLEQTDKHKLGQLELPKNLAEKPDRKICQKNLAGSC
jgi:hypothetical protein